MNLTDRYKKTLIKNCGPGNIFIDGKCIGESEAVVTDTNTAETFLGCTLNQDSERTIYVVNNYHDQEFPIL